jgi:G3E family GTPase
MTSTIPTISSNILDNLSQKMPVTIITGFLGSGKTTLLNHILSNNQGLKIAVLVNEFGDIDIDSQLLASVSEDKIELKNGCICCTIDNNLLEAVCKILQQYQPGKDSSVNYLVIETAGLADPLPIVLQFLGTDLRDSTRLDAILTMVDAETFTPEQYHSEAAKSQLLYSDIILLNKIDLVSTAHVNSLESYIYLIKDHAKVLRSRFGEVPLPLILDVNFAQLGSAAQALSEPEKAAKTNHLNADGFTSISFRSDRPFSLKKFQQFLDHQLPDTVFRAKGILWFDESPACHVFQLSGHRFHIDDSAWVATASPSNQLVIIGRKLNTLQLQQQLTNCLTRCQ